jgi:hypothetical protein
MGNGETIFCRKPSRSGQNGVATHTGALPWLGNPSGRP